MARHWQRASWFAIFLTLAGIAFFVRLGVWQVDRAHQKERLFAAFAGAAEQEPIDLDQGRREADSLRYPLVRLSGHYDVAHSYVLDDQQRGGHAGIMVFDVFEPSDGSVPLLTNQGFLARDVRGQRPPIPAPPAGAQTLLALYAPLPGSGLRLGGNALPTQHSWPKTSIFLDINDISADLGRHLDPRILLLMPTAGSPFVREWKPDVFPPERHFAYAFTWFTFAGVAIVMFVILHWRTEEN